MSNQDFLYSKKYKVSIAEAIADRDEAQTRKDLKKRFFEASGRMPTDDEMAIMRPDSDDTVRQYIIDNYPGDL